MKFAQFFIKALLPVALFTSCTSSSSDGDGSTSPFDDIAWPTTFVPEYIDDQTVLLIGDGANDPGLYPETYFDSGPGRTRFIFTGTPEGGEVTAEGLPILAAQVLPELEDVWAQEVRMGVQNWVTPTSSNGIIGPFSFNFSIPPVEDGAPRPGFPLRPYAYSSMIMHFQSVVTEGDTLVYRGEFIGGTFSMGYGTLYGDEVLDIDGSTVTSFKYSLVGTPFVFTTPIPEPPVEPEPAPDPAP